MTSTQFKLTKDGGLTRRLTLPDRPSWLSLATRIESLFAIPFEKVAVAYEDADGDEVTLSSQDELLDYYSNIHKPGESVKFKVIDLGTLRSGRGGSAPGDDESSTSQSSLRDPFGGGLGSMGPTMVIDVDDWDRLPAMPNLRLFGMSDESGSEPHAFVEVVESDVGSKAGAGSARLTSVTGSAKDKGKGKAKEGSRSVTPNTSEASVVEAQSPAKPDVHIYDVSQAGNMSPRSFAAATPRLYAVNLDEPRYSAFGGAGSAAPRASDVRSDDGSISTVTTTPASPPEDSKPLPKTPSARSAVTPQHPAMTFSSDNTPRAIPVRVESATTDRISEQATTENRPSFVNDVANLVEALTAAFAVHPELSEGLRNIVANSVNGNYWANDAILAAASNMRRTAEEMSEHGARASQNVAQNADNEAIRRIAESLGGVFRTIGDLTSGASNGVPGGPSGPGTTPMAQPQEVPPFMPGGWPHPSGWRRPSQPVFPGRDIPRPFNGGPYAPQGPRSYSAGSYGPNYPVDDSSVPPQNRQLPVRFRERVASTPQRSNTWTGGRPPHASPGMYQPYYLTEQTLGDHNEFHNVHESKAQLEAAKAFYRQEKDRFKKEKEERRRSRREVAERRAEEGRITTNPNEIREETVVARIPLSSPKGGPGASKKGPYAEIYSVTSPDKPVISSVPLNGRQTAPMMFDKVVGRLNDMGFTTETHPNLLTVVNEQLYPNGQPTRLNEEEILTKSLGALRIRGTPSPRPSGSGLQLH